MESGQNCGLRRDRKKFIVGLFYKALAKLSRMAK